MIKLDVKRTAPGETGLNTVVLTPVEIRLLVTEQRMPFLTGIEGAPYSVTLDGALIAAGVTGSHGEIKVPRIAFANGKVVVRALETDYELTLVPAAAPKETVKGQQERLYHLGYMTGHLMDAMGSDPPGDGVFGARSELAVLRFQRESINSLTAALSASEIAQLEGMATS